MSYYIVLYVVLGLFGLSVMKDYLLFYIVGIGCLSALLGIFRWSNGVRLIGVFLLALYAVVSVFVFVIEFSNKLFPPPVEEYPVMSPVTWHLLAAVAFSIFAGVMTFLKRRYFLRKHLFYQALGIGVVAISHLIT